MAAVTDTPTTTAAILQAFKEVYGPRIENQVNKVAFLYREFEKSKQEMAFGKYWAFPVLDEGGQAIGARGDGEQLPGAIAESVIQTQIAAKYNYGVIQISGPAIRQSQSKALAFIQAKDLEVQEKTKSLIADLNRQCYGDSFGTIGAELSDAANTITFDVNQDMSWFRKGMRIDIFDSTRTTKRNGTAGLPNEGRVITVVNKATRTITYSGSDLSASTVAGDLVFREDTRLNLAGTAEGKELNGLRFIVDDTTDALATFQNISGTTFPIWRGARLGNSGTLRPLSLDLIQSGIDQIVIDAGENINFIISGLGQRRMYLNTLWHDVRYEPQDLKGGFTSLQYAGGASSMPWYVDKDCPPQQVIGLTRESIKRYEIQGLGILDEMGAGTVRVSHFDVYEILIGIYANLGATRRNCNFRMVDLQEP